MKRLKFCLAFFLLFTGLCEAQEWQVEAMGGIAGYNGDLTQHRVSARQLGPSLNLSLKYNSGNLINIRGGLFYGRIGADDKNSADADLRKRNLNFKTGILELNLIAEVNLFDPQVFVSYPYLFGGAGLFHFNPFTYDKDHKKTYLQPLSTEGQGLKEYPSRGKYALTQFCLPVGFGWKWVVSDNLEVGYEFGFRILFTDYLDDVSKSYVSVDVLAAEKGPKSAELAYRGPPPFLYEGEARGNPSVNDIYFFSGIKIATNLSNFGKGRH